MEAPVSRVLVVTDRPDPSPALIATVGRRAALGGPARFTLLVPAVAHGLHRVVDPEDQCCQEAEQTIASLLPVLQQVVAGPVEGRIGAHEVFAAVQDAVNAGEADEVILATGGGRVSRLLHVDLPRKIHALGVPVTAVSGGSPQPAAA